MKRWLLAFVMLLASSFALAAVNLNTATKEELDALPGIGPVKAQAIIDYRNANGPFKSPQDVMKVRGINEAEFGKIRDQVSVSGTTSLPPRAAKNEATQAATASPTQARDEKSSRAKEEKAARPKEKEAQAARASAENMAKAAGHKSKSRSASSTAKQEEKAMQPASGNTRQEEKAKP